MFVEFTGVVGSGKSTISSALRSLLRQGGAPALSPGEAIARCLDRSPLCALVSAVLPPSIARRLIRTLYYRLLDHCYAARFALANPALTWHVVESQRGSPVPWSHRLSILSRVFHVGGRHRFLRDRLRKGELVIADEGLVHRAIELYGWHKAPVDPLRVAAYLQLLPSWSPLVVVRSPVDVSLARATVRGLPKGFRNKGAPAIDLFMTNSAEIAEMARRFWCMAGRRVVEVDNGGAPDDVTAGLRQIVQALPLPSETRLSIVRQMSAVD